MAPYKDDKTIYSEAIQSMKGFFGGIYDMSRNDYIVSISRKGPKFLEFLFDDDIRSDYNTLTEYGLPFLFSQLKHGSACERIYIVDDAIYYGTTMQRIHREVRAYCKLAGVQPKIILSAAIRDKDASENLPEVEAYDKVRPGYGHYFIKRLTSDIRRLHNTFEVEYPIIQYRYSGDLTGEQIEQSLIQAFGEENIYHIRHAESESYNILLSKSEGVAFSKIRMYPDFDRKVLNVVPMSPHIIPSDWAAIVGLMNNTPLADVWQQIVQAADFSADGVESEVDSVMLKEINHNRKQSLVVLANYILSFDTFVRQKERLEKAFGILGASMKFEGLPFKYMYYLLPEANLTHLLRRNLHNFYYENIICGATVNNVTLDLKNDSFERADYMLAEDVELLEDQNRHMLENCQNLSEALSALNFNQTVMIEKTMRRRGYYDFFRLKFGYTFGALMSNVRRYAQFPHDSREMLAMHKWTDHRIDQGSMVPQYIVSNNGNWVRVFRPGENEDTVLSHLARYLFFVYKLIDNHLCLGWVPKDFLSQILVAAFLRTDYDLSDALGIRFDVIDSELVFYNDDVKEPRNVLDFAEKMYLISLTDEKVRISMRLSDEEMMDYTTLDNIVESKITARLTDILKTFELSHLSLNLLFLVTNYFTYDVHNRQEASKTIFATCKTVMHYAEHLKNNEVMDWEDFLSCYSSLFRYTIWDKYFSDSDFLDRIASTEEERQIVVNEQRALNTLTGMIELIVPVFDYEDSDFFLQMLNNQERQRRYSSITESLMQAGHALSHDFNSQSAREWFLNEILTQCNKLLNEQ